MIINFKYIFFFVFFVFVTNLNSNNKYNKNPDKPFIVVLDAGHGGHDPGNLGNGYREKDIVLKIVLKVGKILEKQPNFKVIYTRKTDVFVKLHERAPVANRADADLFVSIHCNAVSNHKPYGTETWVLGEKNTDRNFEFAKRENEVIFLEEDYEKNYAGFDPSSPESTIAIGIEQEVYVEQSILLAQKIEDYFPGKAFPKIDSEIKNLAYENNINLELHDRRLSDEEVWEEYNKCDILSLVSTLEGFGMPIIEANVVGRVCITGNTSSMPEIAGNAAHIVNPFDIHDIHLGFKKIIDDKEYRDSLITNGFKNATRFSAVALANQYSKLYNKIAINK